VDIHSRSSVQQGEPLGLLLLALALQGPLRQVAAMDLATPLAHTDGNFLQGAPEPTVQASDALLTLADPLGLHPQLGKCVMYSADVGDAASIASQLGVQHASYGLLAAEIPVSTPLLQAAHVAAPNMPAT
jgi:hypothetical protein